MFKLQKESKGELQRVLIRHSKLLGESTPNLDSFIGFVDESDFKEMLNQAFPNQTCSFIDLIDLVLSLVFNPKDFDQKLNEYSRYFFSND